MSYRDGTLVVCSSRRVGSKTTRTLPIAFCVCYRMSHISRFKNRSSYWAWYWAFVVGRDMSRIRLHVLYTSNLHQEYYTYDLVLRLIFLLQLIHTFYTFHAQRRTNSASLTSRQTMLNFRLLYAYRCTSIESAPEIFFIINYY